MRPFSMLPIFFAFKKTIFLGMKNFWFLFPLTIVTGIPKIYFEWSWGLPKHSSALSPAVALITLATLPLWFLFNAVKTAAILGLLKRIPTETALWSPVWSSVQACTGTLARLLLLLGGIGILTVIPFAVIIKFFGPVKVVKLLAVAFYLVFAKYALADPLVVNENMGARTALRRSWEMTRGHFGYVGGCYLVLGGGMWLVRWIFEAPLHTADGSLTGVFVLTHFCFELASSLWIILAWCMYLEIKAVDGQIASVANVFATQSPPESPSASQSA